MKIKWEDTQAHYHSLINARDVATRIWNWLLPEHFAQTPSKLTLLKAI